MSGATLYQDFLTPPADVSDGSDGAGDEEIRLARARGKARADGYADGVATAEAAFDRDLRARIDAVSGALSAAASEKAAADEAAVEAVRRIVMETLTAFLPMMSDNALPGVAANAVAAALRTDLDGALVVEAHPDRLADIETALSVRDKRIVFAANEALPQTAARICWRDGFDHIDTATAIAAGLAILNERLRNTCAPEHKEKDQ